MTASALQKLKLYQPLPPEAEKELWAKLEGNGTQEREEAIQTLTLHNLRLAIHIAHIYRDFAELDDLISEGIIGIHLAASQYKPHICAFSTFASVHVNQRIWKYLAEKNSTIRLPVHAGGKLRKLQRAKNLLEWELGYTPTPTELAEETGIDTKKIAELEDCQFTFLPLDAKLGADSPGNETIADTLIDPHALDPQAQTQKKLDAEKVTLLLKTLKPRDQEILKLRYGIGGKETHTLDEIASRYQLTRERVRQIQEKCHRLLRNKLTLAFAWN